MSRDNLNVPLDPALNPPRSSRYRPPSPYDTDDGLERFSFPPPAPAALQQTTMDFTQENFLALQALAQQQAKQIEDGNTFANDMATQLQESKRQQEASQKSIADLTTAFNNLNSNIASQSRPLTLSTAPKKKPELPPFDSKNVLIWIRRVEAAYARVGVIEPRDRFAWMESIFQVGLDPQIDSYLYGTNTLQDWEDFIEYLKQQYGPTLRQKAQKLMGEIPRHDLKPSQYLLRLKDDVKDVEIDHILKEHVLKSIPPRIREIMGKEVEGLTAEQVAKQADDFFDRHGRPTEKISAPINHVTSSSNHPSTTTTSAATAASTPSSFTPAFSDDDEADVNFVKRGGQRNNDRGRSFNRGQRSRSRPSFNRQPNASSTGNSSNNSSTSSSFAAGTCRWHRRFGDKSLKCYTDCPLFKSFTANQKQGNGQGGRRM